MMKKILATLLTTTMMFGLMACGKSNSASSDSAEVNNQANEETTETAAENEKLSFAFFTNTLNNTFHNAMVETYEAKCKEMG